MSARSLGLIFAFVCGSMLGCDSGLKAPQWSPPDPSTLSKDFVECIEDSDCVRVELGCCDACNGGADLAIHTSQVERAKQQYGEPCTSETVCTQLACTPQRPVCEGGVCGLVERAPE